MVRFVVSRAQTVVPLSLPLLFWGSLRSLSLPLTPCSLSHSFPPLPRAQNTQLSKWQSDASAHKTLAETLQGQVVSLTSMAQSMQTQVKELEAQLADKVLLPDDWFGLVCSFRWFLLLEECFVTMDSPNGTKSIGTHITRLRTDALVCDGLGLQ